MKKLKKLLLSFLGIFSLIPGKIFGNSMSGVYGPPKPSYNPVETLKQTIDYAAIGIRIIFVLIAPFVLLVGLVVYIAKKVKAKEPISIIVVIVLSVIGTLLILVAMNFLLPLM